jgi:hypothetical protein
MATKVTVLAVPRELRYDHEEILHGGAQFCRFDTLEHLKSYWQRERTTMRYACVGTAFIEPARFLDPHEWIFSPSKEALVAAVVRWDEFRIAPRWYDMMSDELSVGLHLQRRRISQRDLRIALGTWSPQDEAAHVFNSQRGRGRGRQGFWRLDNLPCSLTHFDWFSEHAQFPNDPQLPKERAEVLLQRSTFDDWKNHQTLNDVEMLDGSGVDQDIAYWERERAAGRDPYED